MQHDIAIYLPGLLAVYWTGFLGLESRVTWFVINLLPVSATPVDHLECSVHFAATQNIEKSQAADRQWASEQFISTSCWKLTLSLRVTPSDFTPSNVRILFVIWGSGQELQG